MEHPVRDFHPSSLVRAQKKPGLTTRPGFAIYDLRLRWLQAFRLSMIFTENRDPPCDPTLP